MQLPIKFKYFTLQEGFVAPTKTDELGFKGYLLMDENGVQLAAGTSLGGLIAHAQQADITMEIAAQFVARKMENFAHLAGIDIDAAPEQPAGLMLPPGMPPQRH